MVGFFVGLICPGLLRAEDSPQPTTTVQGQFVKISADPGSGQITEMSSPLAPANLVATYGFLNEGFGIVSPYIPCRRINEQWKEAVSPTGQTAWGFSYDCEGANIDGLHITRTMEPLTDEASLRVNWKIENKGQQCQWIAPWMRNDCAPGGSFSLTAAGQSRNRAGFPFGPSPKGRAPAPRRK